MKVHLFLPLVGVLFETFFFNQVDSHRNLDFFLSCLLSIFFLLTFAIFLN